MLTELSSWKALKKHFEFVRGFNMRELFEDLERQKKLSVEFDGIYFDYSKNRVTEETLELFLKLCKEVDLESRVEAMFGGEKVNYTEDRAALHVELRDPGADSEVKDVLARMGEFSEQIRGEGRFKNIINIGIGGSNLGPEMVYEALRDYSDRGLNLGFVSNVDPSDFYERTYGLAPSETLFLVASKSFSTDETMSNASAAKEWLSKELSGDVGEHFVGLTANTEKAVEFGINEDRVFPLWDFVGGRYSVMSAIGLVNMIAMGKENFLDLLSGARSVDEHFRSASYSENIPVIMGMLSVWYNNFFDFETHGVAPYSSYLYRFPAYLQQLEMESNGKSAGKNGRVSWDTAPIVWGEPGTDGQHSFFQLLHQGTRIVPVDFIAFVEPNHEINEQHEKLLANCFAQSKALAFGHDDPDQNRTFDGNRPSNTFLLEKLTPRALGQLIAFYEHKTFVEGVVWGINSFDQFGVELGKRIAKEILPEIKGQGDLGQDCSTNELVRRVRKSG